MAGVAEVMLENPWVLLLLPVGWLLLVLFAWPRRFKPFGAFLVRLVIVVLLTLALAKPVLPVDAAAESRLDEQQVVLVDQSASLGTVGRQALRGEAGRIIQQIPEAQVIFFADHPVRIDEPLADPVDTVAQLNREITDLAAALDFSVDLMSAKEEMGRVVLLSDGVPTTGEVESSISNLVQQEVPVDVVLFDTEGWHENYNEVQTVAIDLPNAVRQGETFDLGVTIHSEQPVSATLRISRDGNIIAEDLIALDQGPNRFDHTTALDEEGVHSFNVEISTSAGNDRQLQNNSLSAVTQVYAPPTVLVVTDDRQDQGAYLAALLDEAGFETEVITPEQLPTRLSDLELYDGMVLLNVSAASLELEQMIAVQEFVRSLGRGLLVTGGRNSYTLGQYADTPLADLLPLELQPPPREERPPVALLLIIDHSGSMMEMRGDMPSRLTMAKEAAIRATEILGPDDLIGVLMFDNRYEWVIPFQEVSDGVELLNIQEQIARIPGGGGTRILQALDIGIPEMIQQDTANSRHIVLLTDGKSFDGLGTIEDYDTIVDQGVEANITLSTIAIGQGSDEELLTYLAERGQGRYHYAATPEELPELTISESDILRSDVLQEGDFEVAIFDRHSIIRSFFLSADDPPPPLSAYLALNPKEQAETALQVGPGDALLSVWGYGLGRVAAWSSDIGDEWATAWRNYPGASRFWGQVLGYTLPAPDLPTGLQLQTGLDSNGTATLVAESFTATGQPIDLARTKAYLVLPGGEEREIILGQVAPGHYERQVRLPGPGAYRFTVEQTQADTELNRGASTGFVLPYAAEYALPAEGSGELLLRGIANLTGGEILFPGQLLPAATASAPATESESPTELWPWLLQAALILWPIEIAWRRWGRLRIQ